MGYLKANWMALAIGVAIGVFVVPIVKNKIS